MGYIHDRFFFGHPLYETFGFDDSAIERSKWKQQKKIHKKKKNNKKNGIIAVVSNSVLK